MKPIKASSRRGTGLARPQALRVVPEPSESAALKSLPVAYLMPTAALSQQPAFPSSLSLIDLIPPQPDRRQSAARRMAPRRLLATPLAAGIVGSALGLLGVPAAAADEPPDAEALAACAAMAEAVERLACYDKALGRPIDTRAFPEARDAGTTNDMATTGAASNASRPSGSGDSRTGSTRLKESAPLKTGRGAPLLANPPATSPRLPSLGSEAADDADDAARFQREALEQRRSLGSSLADRWELDKAYDRGRFALSAYKPMYVLLADWTTRKNETPTSPNPVNVVTEPIDQRSVEANFQISFKTKIIEDMIAGHGDLWLGYTQQSHWQIYNPGGSRPFRETNYEPEVMAVFRTDYSLLGWQGRMVGLALNHQSNGRDEPQSRSWNRVIAMFGLERGNWTMMLRPWWRIPEAAASDDNPDIPDYAGRMEWLLIHQSEGHELSLLARHSLRTGGRSHGAIQLSYALPISSFLKGYVQVFSGYGASLLDYNHRQTRIGFGISMVQWL